MRDTKKIPLKVIFTEDQETSSSEKFSQSTEDMFHLFTNSPTERSYYPFSILKSRKKEKPKGLSPKILKYYK